MRAQKPDEDGPEGRQQPAPEALAVRGPMFPAILSPPMAMAKKSASLPTAQGLAIVDTGASITCFDSDRAKALQLPIVDAGRVVSVSHIVTDVPVFAGTLVIPGLGEFAIERAMGARLSLNNHEETPPIVALIGRDILARCVLTYHGVEGFVSLSI